MLGWMKRHKILTGLLALLLIPVTLGGLNYSGMCIPEGRWLSDEAKIRLAASAVANNTPNHNYLDEYFRKKMGDEAFYRSFDEPDGPKSSYETIYSRYYDPAIWEKGKYGYRRIGVVDVDEFMRKNPSCCKIMGRIAAPFSWPLIDGMAESVEVRYMARFLDKHGKIVDLENYIEYKLVGNCGNILQGAP